MLLNINQPDLVFQPYHPKSVNLTGQRFGKLLILGIHSKTQRGESRWLWMCECGRVGHSVATNLNTGNSTTCGRKPCRTYATAHGDCVDGTLTREYITYSTAKSRCQNPHNNKFQDYGGRGVEFCFESFEEFLAEVGRKPTPKHTIERIDVNGHYEQGNVRWATAKEQASNRRNTVKYTFQGQTLIATDWCALVGIHHSVFSYRIKHNWPLEKILTTPTRRKH